MAAASDHAGPLPFDGRVVAVTGRLAHYTRDQAEERIRKLGGTVGSGVTRKTDYLIVGADAGSKLAKAQELGIRTLTEDEFRQLGAGEHPPPPASKPAPAPSAPRVTPTDLERDPVEWARALDQARGLVGDWLDRGGGRRVYGQRPGDTPEGKAVLDSLPIVQVAAIRALLDVMVGLRPDIIPGMALGAQVDWQRRWKAKELLGALLRRRQPLMPEDVEALVAALPTADGRSPRPEAASLLGDAIPEILRGLSFVASPDQWTPGQRATLERLLDHLPQTWAARGDRLKVARLLRALLGAPAVEETAEPDEAVSAELPPRSTSDPEALRREAGGHLDAFLRDVGTSPATQRLVGASERRSAKELREIYASPEPWRIASDPREYPTGRALLALEAPLQLAVWEAALARLLPIPRSGGWPTRDSVSAQALQNLLGLLLTGRLDPVVADVAGALDRLPEARGIWDNFWYAQAPIGRLLDRIESDGLAGVLRPRLRTLRERAAAHAGKYGVRDLLIRLDRLLADYSSPVEAVDDWGYAAQAALDALDEPRRGGWVRLLAYARDVSGGKPSARWLKGAGPLIESLGADAHLELTAAWLDLLKAESPVRQDVPEQTYSYVRSAVPTETNAAILRGLAWLCTLGETRRIADQLAAAAIRCYQKVPGAGPRAIAVGNACLYALETLDPLESVRHLQAVRHRVTYLPALKLVDAALEDAARRSGMSKEELEDLTVPTFGLEDGRRREELGEYAAELVVEPGGVELRWSKAGTPLRSEPAAARRAFPEEVKALKATADEVRQHLPVQRERLEQALMVGRAWTLEAWRERCLDHPLVSILARRLIWGFETPTARLAAWDGQNLVDVEDRSLGPLPPETRVRLWHPIGWDPSVVLAWREWLERHAVTQPFKQAHREVYLLTDAELRTRTYSNRFAAHVLRQHQMHALAQQRGWKAPLAMVYDGGWDVELTRALPAWGLEASYFVECALDGDNLEAGYNDNGVCLYVATDQVRFRRVGEPEPLPLAGVPALAFSEAMRDVDLFVGVASVGADPTWYDRGTDQQRAYWQRYAFGELSESARTRRVVLERLLPRLAKLAGRWKLADRFLTVRGDLRTYKIHLGSGNILMEPNDQYLCIVPDRRSAAAPADGLFLPFEGDAALGLILSKALLLAEDTKIADETILRQIRAGLRG